MSEKVTEEELRELGGRAGVAVDDHIEALKEHEEARKKRRRELRKQISKKGALNLPPLLDKRRREYDVIDGAFQFQCTYDRILVKQISQFGDQETYGDTRIFMPHTMQESEKNTAPRGVLIGAGLSALDSLHSNGIALGHIVTFIRDAVWHYRIGVIQGQDEYVLILRAGDILGSEDLAQSMRAGKCRIHLDRDNKHKLVRGGKKLEPFNPKIPEEY